MIIAVLTVFLLLSCYSDISRRLIPNYLTFGLMITGLAYNTWAGPGWYFSLLGIGTGFVLFLLPFLFTGMGAGDVKLMMGVGSVLGFQQTIVIGIISSILAALYALIKFASKGKHKELIHSTIGQASYILTKTHLNDFSRENIEGDTIPFAVLITLSTFSVLLWGWLT